MMKTESKYWLMLNAVLLVLYLGFFHICLLIEASYWPWCGTFFAVVWMAVISWKKSVFKNSYEYFFYSIVALDIFIEGFIPLHEGYGFYYCALGFWLVFIFYHCLDTSKLKCLCSKKTSV